jgi:hypothetical protein
MGICKHKSEIFDSNDNLLPGVVIESGPHSSCGSCYPAFSVSDTDSSYNQTYGYMNVNGLYCYHSDNTSGLGENLSGICIDSSDLYTKYIYKSGNFYLFYDYTSWYDCGWIVSDVDPNSLVRETVTSPSHTYKYLEEQAGILYWSFPDDDPGMAIWFAGYVDGHISYDGVDFQVNLSSC